MLPVGFEPTISAGERPQTYALDRAATGTGKWYTYPTKLLCKFYRIYIIYKCGRGLETHDLNSF